MEVNKGHRGDRTLDQTRSLFDQTRPVSVQRLRVSRFSERTQWSIRSRSTGLVRSLWELTGLQPDAGTMTSDSSSVRVQSLIRWSVARLDQRVRSVMGPARPVEFARPVNSTSVFGRASRMGGVCTCASDQFD
jgi:hypothetical protein